MSLRKIFFRFFFVSTGNGDNQFHRFTAEERNELQKSVLAWYDENKRDLPWRELVSTT